MNGKESKQARTTAARLAVRRGEFVQLRRRILSETWAWYACLVVVGAILIVPGRSHRVPPLAAGEIASSDIVVDREVVLPDSESTEEKRRRASFEVLPVYVYDPGVAATLVEKLDRIFQEGGRQSQGDDFDLAQRLGEVGSLVVQPREAAVLRGARFSEELLGLLRDVVQGLYREGIVGDRTELLHSAERGVALRVAGSGEERTELDVYRFLDGGSGLTEVVEQRLAAEQGIRRPWRSPARRVAGARDGAQRDPRPGRDARAKAQGGEFGRRGVGSPAQREGARAAGRRGQRPDGALARGARRAKHLDADSAAPGRRGAGHGPPGRGVVVLPGPAGSLARGSAHPVRGRRASQHRRAGGGQRVRIPGGGRRRQRDAGSVRARRDLPARPAARRRPDPCRADVRPSGRRVCSRLPSACWCP